MMRINILISWLAVKPISWTPPYTKIPAKTAIIPFISAQDFNQAQRLSGWRPEGNFANIIFVDIAAKKEQLISYKELLRFHLQELDHCLFLKDWVDLTKSLHFLDSVDTDLSWSLALPSPCPKEASPVCKSSNPEVNFVPPSASFLDPSANLLALFSNGEAPESNWLDLSANCPDPDCN